MFYSLFSFFPWRGAAKHIFSEKGGGHLLIWTIFLQNIYLQLGIEDFEYVAVITLKIPKHVVVNFEFFKLFVKNYKGV